VRHARTSRQGHATAVFIVLLAGLALPPVTEGADTRLRDAIQAHDVVTAQALIKSGADVNVRQPDGATPLHWAVHYDEIDIVEALLAAGAKADVANDYGFTPLMLACENGSAAAIERLLGAGADPNRAMPSGETPLMIASRTGRVGAVTALLRAGADVNAAESLKGQTALMWALSGPHFGAAKALVEAGADVHARSTGGFTPLMFATRYDSVDSVQLLLGKGARLTDEAEDGATPFIVAVLRGHVGLAKYFLELGADPDVISTGYTALQFAAATWDGVDSRDYVNAPGEWAILAGLPRADKLDMIKTLIAHGADPNLRLLKEPPRYGFSLVAGSAKQYTAGATAFALAAMAGDVEVMQILLAGGADPNVPTRNGSTALMLAAGMAWMDNETIATEAEYLSATEFCLRIGMDIDGTNATGNTALHGTISGGFNEVIKVLAANGANLDAKNKRGQTAFKMSLGYGAAGGQHVREDTAALLRQLGATDE